MAKVLWLLKRLKAMSFQEVLWRLSQKNIQGQEEKRFAGNKVPVTAGVFNNKLSLLQLYGNNLSINFNNKAFGLNTLIHLPAGFEYEKYKTMWNAGFQTRNIWPDKFSYKLEYKQRDDIGDARTNWELNRHFQLAILAKNYAASGDVRYLEEFEGLFSDWNEKNVFLYGISWTSVMEVAIRCSNWCYSYAFLNYAKAPENLLEKLRIGIINMTDYIVSHYSRFSSANNHLIVEAYVIGQSGILLDYHEWTDLAVRLLTEQLSIQNYEDGVNKELSLHYQSFYMEAMGLMMRLLEKNSIAIPVTWKPMLKKMSQYVADCIGDYGEAVVFGDDDEGKILDLQGSEIAYYQYVLGLMSVLLDKRYVKELCCETLYWLFTEEELERANRKDEYIGPQYCCYKDGGNTILRSRDRKILIGIDHAALGFGSIAAHGHADALSFQLFYEGRPVFVDPGTFIYHCDLNSRNKFRKTRNHNTVCVNQQDQSEMLGAFLWGKRAETTLLSCEQNEKWIRLTMKHDGYFPIMHHRVIEFDADRKIVIKDWLSQPSNATASFIAAPDIRISIEDKEAKLYQGPACIAKVKCRYGVMRTENYEYSEKYGIKQPTTGLAISFDKECSVEINLL